MKALVGSIIGLLILGSAMFADAQGYRSEGEGYQLPERRRGRGIRQAQPQYYPVPYPYPSPYPYPPQQQVIVPPVVVLKPPGRTMHDNLTWLIANVPPPAAAAGAGLQPRPELAPRAAPSPLPPRPERRVERVVLQSVHFEFDSSRLTPEGRRVLDDAAQTLRQNPSIAVEIEGHTDSVGTELYNLGLGKRRAEAVKAYLVFQHRLDARRMTTQSYGESRPIADNSTEEGRALNRRVEFKVIFS